MEWIKINDKLPQYTDDYICYCNIGSIMWGYKEVRCYRYEKIKGKEPRWCIPSNFDEIITITYWMDLPEPPKED